MVVSIAHSYERQSARVQGWNSPCKVLASMLVQPVHKGKKIHSMRQCLSAPAGFTTIAVKPGCVPADEPPEGRPSFT